MKKGIFIGICILISWLGSGCTPTRTVWKPEPEVLKASNPYFNTELSLYCDTYGCIGFNLFMENKVGKDLEVDWSKTFYLSQGQEDGGFFFEGIILRDKNVRKPPETLVAYGVLSKRLTPENIVSVDKGTHYRNMDAGEHGVLLTVRVDGKEVNEKLTIHLFEMEIKEGAEDPRKALEK